MRSPVRQITWLGIAFMLFFGGTFSFSKTYDACKSQSLKACKWSASYGLPSRDPAYMVCAQPIWDYCNCKYRPERVAASNVNKDCQMLLTKYTY